MLVILLSFYVIWFLSVLEKLITIIYEIAIILVKLQTDYRYPNSHFSVDDQVIEFIRPENTSTFNFESFKYKLKQHYFKNAPPSYYNIGNKYLNILHTRIRNNCSALHNDLFHANLIHNRLVLVDIPQRMLNIFYCIARGLMHKEIFCTFFISCKCKHCLKHFAVWKSNL